MTSGTVHMRCHCSVRGAGLAARAEGHIRGQMLRDSGLQEARQLQARSYRCAHFCGVSACSWNTCCKKLEVCGLGGLSEGLHSCCGIRGSRSYLYYEARVITVRTPPKLCSQIFWARSWKAGVMW